MEKIIKEKVEKEMQELKSRMQECYYSKSGLNEAKKYIKGLMSRAERKNGWGRCQKCWEKAHHTGCSSLSVVEDGMRMN